MILFDDLKTLLNKQEWWKYPCCDKDTQKISLKLFYSLNNLPL